MTTPPQVTATTQAVPTRKRPALHMVVYWQRSNNKNGGYWDSDCPREDFADIHRLDLDPLPQNAVIVTVPAEE